MTLILQLLLLLLFPPLLLGIAQRVKSIVAGRRGPPLLQPYHDLVRLLRKGSVTSLTGTWVGALAAPVVLASTVLAFLLVPMLDTRAPLAFGGDLALFVYLLALARFALVLLAMDAGSSFEGMGASREVWLASMAEPALFLSLGALTVLTGETSLSGLLAATGAVSGTAIVRLLVALAIAIVLLAETARIPVDDPATHLELTMIHEVMLLDTSGPDLALCEWANAVKLFGLAALLAHVVAPAGIALAWLVPLAGAVLAALLVGVVESVTARLAMRRVPQLLIGAAVLAGVALGTALGTR